VGKRRTAFLALSILLSVLFLAALLKKVRPSDFLDVLTSVYLPALLLYMVINLAAAVLRAWRYKRLLEPVRIGWFDLLLVTFIRNSFDDLLPARIGSLSYIYVLTGRLERPFENVASSFLVALVFDFLTLGPFLVLAVLAAGFGTEGIPAPAQLIAAAVFFLVFLLIIRNLVPLTRFIRNLVGRGARLKGKTGRAAEKAAGYLDRTIDSLRGTRERGIYPGLFVVSLLIRLGKYLSLFVLLYAVLRSQGVALGELNVWTTILGLTGAEMTSALPIKGLAGFGTWETAWAAALRWMKFDPRLAILSGLGIHLITNVFEYALGLSGIAILALRRKHDRISRNP